MVQKHVFETWLPKCAVRLNIYKNGLQLENMRPVNDSTSLSGGNCYLNGQKIVSLTKISFLLPSSALQALHSFDAVSH